MFSEVAHRALYSSSVDVISQLLNKILTPTAGGHSEDQQETLIMTVESLSRLNDQQLLATCIRCVCVRACVCARSVYFCDVIYLLYCMHVLSPCRA